MDLRKIKKLIELVEESGISELEVKSGDEAVRIARPTLGEPAFALAPRVAESSVVIPAADTPRVGQSEGRGGEGASVDVRAPMAGTFYAASSPDAAPYVRIGQSVSAGEVVCIIESMKMMNEIKAEVDGTVTEILVENTEPVASGQRLFLLRSS